MTSNQIYIVVELLLNQIEGTDRSKLIDKIFKIRFFLNMNLAGFSYNLQQTESKSAH